MRPEENGVCTTTQKKALQPTRQKMKAIKILKDLADLHSKASDTLCQDNLFL